MVCDLIVFAFACFCSLVCRPKGCWYDSRACRFCIFSFYWLVWNSWARRSCYWILAVYCGVWSCRFLHLFFFVVWFGNRKFAGLISNQTILRSGHFTVGHCNQKIAALVTELAVFAFLCFCVLWFKKWKCNRFVFRASCFCICSFLQGCNPKVAGLIPVLDVFAIEFLS